MPSTPSGHSSLPIFGVSRILEMLHIGACGQRLVHRARMETLPTLGVEKENRWAEEKLHHGHTHGQANEGHETCTTIVAVAGNEVGRHRDQKFEASLACFHSICPP